MHMKSILAAILVPAAFALAGFGSSTPAAATIGKPLPPVGSTCETVLCSPGAVCVDTANGPVCVPDPNGPSDS
jgi:hypothetical protein